MRNKKKENEPLQQLSSSEFLHGKGERVTDLQDKAFELIRYRYELTNTIEIEQAYANEVEFKERSQDHQQAFERANKEWALLGQLQHQRFSLTQRARLSLEHIFASVNDNPKPILAIASAVVFAVILPLLLFMQEPVVDVVKLQPSAINKNTLHYRTGYGYREEYVLSDGSVVNLNWNTSISVDMSKSQRLITLHKGEAYFKVAKNPNRPFIVSVDNVTAKAIGTEFNVKKRDDNFADIAVAEGVVAVSTVNFSEQAQQKRLVANQVVTFKNTSLGLVDTRRVENINAWRQGLIVFEQQPLREALEEINRYTSYDIIINLTQTNDDNVTANFFVDSADDAMQSLVNLFNLQVEKRNNRVIISEPS